MNKQYISYNGLYKSENDFILKAENRAFKYGDALFETMFAPNNEIIFFQDHINRLISSMKILKMNVHLKFLKEAYIIHNEIKRLLHKNKIFTGARVRLTVFRNDGGLYTPSTNDVSYIIETTSLNKSSYKLNEKGLKIQIFNEILKPINKLSNLKTTNTLLYILAGLFKTENKLDDVIILNTAHNISEALSSNVFLIKKNTISTPALSESCVNGIMRKNIIKITKDIGMEVITEKISPQELLQADEIFLTNAVNGIQWVGGYNTKRYYNKIAKKIIIQLNKNIS